MGEPGGLLSMGSHRVGHKIRTMWHDIGEDNGTSLQYSCLAWKIPWIEEPGRLPSMGSQKKKKHPLVTQGTQEMWVRSLGGADSLEESMTTHSSIPAWSIPWTGEPGRLLSTGSQRVRHD